MIACPGEKQARKGVWERPRIEAAAPTIPKKEGNLPTMWGLVALSSPLATALLEVGPDGVLTPSQSASPFASGAPGPWGSFRAVQSQIETIRMARTGQPEKASVAELTEKQKGPATKVQYVQNHWVKDDHVVGFNELPTTRADTRESMVKQAKQMSSGIRCGFSWDDAAVKCGNECTTQCRDGKCFADLPKCDHMFPAGKCYGIANGVSDAWCVDASKTLDGLWSTDPKGFYKNCICEETVVGLNTPIEPHEPVINASQLPPRSPELVEMIKAKEKTSPGMPDCTWKPDNSCKNTTQYECIDGPKAGQCSGENWYYRPDECSSSCVHTALLKPAPYYAVWRKGPRALPFSGNALLPHYAAKGQTKDSIAQAAFDNPQQILMSVWCKSSQIAFVGVSLFSPKYEDKARRLLGSCNKLGVCCKATEVGSNYLGPEAPEGSEEFRYRTISLKPAFLLDQLQKTKEPVVFLDVDLEFHKFPELFLPDSWPEGSRDVALFNFWANETNVTYRHTPNIGSAVAFFNHTYRAKKLLTAWAEAMKYKTNDRAPDDQVLDKLLNEGGWQKRVSLGWLPAAYLRTMPAYYRGIDPVIDHDRGTSPGIIGHSMLKPLLPPVLWTEKVDEQEPW